MVVVSSRVVQAKKTTIVNSDIDCVLFINNEEPLFEKVLDDFEFILTTTDSYQIRDVHQTKYSIQFKALKYDFDILPAVNFTVNHVGGGDEMIDIQQQHVLDRIKLDPKRNGYMYSSSLADATVRFMKQQSSFAHEMVRIVKFWYQTLYFPKYISGAKSFVELIAVYAAKKEEKMETKLFLRCFKQFIDYLKNFEHLNIHFEISDSKLLDKSRPRVMDPVNPYNNLAKNWDQKSIMLMKEYAKETGRRLDCLAAARVVRLNELFEPHLRVLPIVNEVFQINPKHSQWLVGSVSEYSSLPDLKVRNEEFRKPELWDFVEFLKKAFQFVIYAALASPNRNSNEVKVVKEAIQEMISRQISKPDIVWSSAENEKHEDYDITFTIPFKNQYAVRISYRL